MHVAVIYMPLTGAAPIGFAQAAGMPGDIRFDFKAQGGWAMDMTSYYPQLVLRPFTQPMTYAYDIDINDPVGGSGIVTVPGVVMNDRFHVEVYTRLPTGQPLDLLAYGRIDLTGYAYRGSGPLGPASFPTGPSGPAGLKGETGAQGPAGDPGLRGSRWYTGPGAPQNNFIPDDRVDGDMWLDESNGDVWRWNATAQTWSAFKGV